MRRKACFDRRFFEPGVDKEVFVEAVVPDDGDDGFSSRFQGGQRPGNVERIGRFARKRVLINVHFKTVKVGNMQNMKKMRKID